MLGDYTHNFVNKVIENQESCYHLTEFKLYCGKVTDYHVQNLNN